MWRAQEGGFEFCKVGWTPILILLLNAGFFAPVLTQIFTASKNSQINPNAVFMKAR
jgi:hypothetical protein